MERKELKKEVTKLHEQVSDLVIKLDEHPSYEEIFEQENFLHREYISKRYLVNLQQHYDDLQELKRWLMNVTV